MRRNLMSLNRKVSQGAVGPSCPSGRGWGGGKLVHGDGLCCEGLGLEETRAHSSPHSSPVSPCLYPPPAPLRVSFLPQGTIPRLCSCWHWGIPSRDRRDGAVSQGCPSSWACFAEAWEHNAQAAGCVLPKSWEKGGERGKGRAGRRDKPRHTKGSPASLGCPLFPLSSYPTYPTNGRTGTHRTRGPSPRWPGGGDRCTQPPGALPQRIPTRDDCGCRQGEGSRNTCEHTPRFASHQGHCQPRVQSSAG